jgi:hypothetical protein
VSAGPRATRRFACVLACCAAAGGCGSGPVSPATGGSSVGDEPALLLRDTFSAANGPNGIVTNAWALFHPGGVTSRTWEMTSGSLFSRAGAGWSGAPDDGTPDRLSRRATGSAVFRLRTARASFRDVRVDAEIRVNRWSKARRGALPAIVLWVRYASERSLYWPSVLRADAKVDVEKKVPGGPFPDNAGTYYILAPYTQRGWPVSPGRWYRVAVTVRNGADGSVTISTYRDGRRMTTSVDRGAGQRVQVARTGDGASNPTAALRRAGGLGIRGDNADFDVRSYEVRALPRLGGAAHQP